MNNNKILTVNCYGQNYDVILQRSTYTNNGNFALCLFCPTEGPFATLTVNIDLLPDWTAAIDTNNNPWAEEFITQHKLGTNTGNVLESGFCTYPVYVFDPKRIEELAE